MSEENEETTSEQTKKATEESAYHALQDKPVIIQLFAPYVAGVDKEGNSLGTPILQGVYRIAKDEKGEPLLVVNTSVGDNGNAIVTVRFDQVAHVTYVEERRIQSP
jgi:hypothetical protein